ncbi:MAG: hypothetical protein PVI42_21525 [Desulfobacterales bacterium]|jgi:hypothetical protein
MEDCTPDVPIDRQIRHAIGVEYNWECRLSTGVRIVYSDYGKVKLDNDSLKGDTNEMTFFFPDTQARLFENRWMVPIRYQAGIGAD